MGVKKGHVIVSAQVPVGVVELIDGEAANAGQSRSQLLAGWIHRILIGHIHAPIVSGKLQRVRRDHDELMVSIPRDFIRRAGLHAKDDIEITYSCGAMIVRKHLPTN